MLQRDRIEEMTLSSNTFKGFGAPLVAQMVKNLPVMQEAWIHSLGQDDPLQKGMATHSNILAWRIPWTEELVGYSLCSQKKGQT